MSRNFTLHAQAAGQRSNTGQQFATNYSIGLHDKLNIWPSRAPEGYKDRREGKGRRCCLGDRIESIPCRASYFAPG